MSTLYAMPGNESFCELLARHGALPRNALRVHRFPDGETLVRVQPGTARGHVAIVCTLSDPDPKVVPLLMAAATLRELGAERVGLVAPYLAYMRQDQRFHEGEAVSARIFAQLLSASFDWLVTVDPHLHRYHRLTDVYSLDARVIHAAPRVADWIREHVHAPLIIGPDGESSQWVSDVAGALDAPFVVATKERHGDRDVRVHLPGIEAWPDHTPVLVDDIIASGQTMVETLRALPARAAVCIGVHGLLADHALTDLQAAGAARVVTCNTVAASTGLIDISADVAATVTALCTA